MRLFACARYLLALAWIGAAPVAASAASYTQLIVFGDSLSDVGNAGRYTDSYLWGEHLAGAKGLTLTASSQGGTDYAISGALITAGGSSLPIQLQSYLAGHPHADAHALYVIWGGGNDVFSTLGNPSGSAAVVTAGVADTVGMINSLYTAGARNFLIGNVPRTDLTPYVRGLGASAMAQQAGVVISWNFQLERALSGLHKAGAHIWRYNSAAGLLGISTSPTHFGFTNYTTGCNGSCADPAHTFFWDGVHPASTGHASIATAMLTVLSQ